MSLPCPRLRALGPRDCLLCGRAFDTHRPSRELPPKTRDLPAPTRSLCVFRGPQCAATNDEHPNDQPGDKAHRRQYAVAAVLSARRQRSTVFQHVVRAAYRVLHDLRTSHPFFTPHFTPQSLRVVWHQMSGFRWTNCGKLAAFHAVSCQKRGFWRRRWDSNPRDPSGPTPLAGERLRPLGHVSAAVFKRGWRAIQPFSVLTAGWFSARAFQSCGGGARGGEGVYREEALTKG